MVYVKVKKDGKSKCQSINKAKADKYDRVYKDSKCTKVLEKKEH